MKTNELSGAALDWAVAMCEGLITGDEFDIGFIREGGYTPSTDWAQGGPIIEREWLSIECWPNESDENTAWAATRYDQPAISEAYGPTPLIAAMRCYVASRLGDEVDVPPELT